MDENEYRVDHSSYISRLVSISFTKSLFNDIQNIDGITDINKYTIIFHNFIKDIFLNITFEPDGFHPIYKLSVITEISIVENNNPILKSQILASV
jgi:hypothetical protein